MKSECEWGLRQTISLCGFVCLPCLIARRYIWGLAMTRATRATRLRFNTWCLLFPFFDDCINVQMAFSACGTEGEVGQYCKWLKTMCCERESKTEIVYKSKTTWHQYIMQQHPKKGSLECLHFPIRSLWTGLERKNCFCCASISGLNYFLWCFHLGEWLFGMDWISFWVRRK